jgi:ankyrin repeat protein
MPLAAREGHHDVVAEFLKLSWVRSAVDSQGYDRRTALHLAVERGEVVKKESARRVMLVRALLEAGASPARVDSCGRTPLHFAACVDNVPIIKALLEAKAPIDAVATNSNATALQLACARGYLGVVKELLDAGASTEQECKTGGGTALQFAAFYGHLEVVKALLASTKESAISKTKAMSKAQAQGHHDVVSAMKAAGVTWQGFEWLLARAANEGQVTAVKELLEAGVPPDVPCQFNVTALYYAAKKGNVEIVNALLAAGATLKAADTTGQTAARVRSMMEKLLGGDAVETKVNAKGDPTLALSPRSAEVVDLTVDGTVDPTPTLSPRLPEAVDLTVDAKEDPTLALSPRLAEAVDAQVDPAPSLSPRSPRQRELDDADASAVLLALSTQSPRVKKRPYVDEGDAVALLLSLSESGRHTKSSKV